MNKIQELLNYETNNEFPDFPSDNLGYFREIIKESSINIDETRINIPDEITALATIYDTDGNIDYQEMEKMILQQKKAGINTLLIAGTTGESSFLDHQEQIEYINKASQVANNNGMQIIAGTGSNSTSEQNELSQGAINAGAVANLLLPPYYIKASDSDIIRHLKEGLDIGPSIIYSITGRTGVTISTEIIEILSKHPNFLGVKECDGQERINELKKLGIRVWSGNDDSSFWDIHEHNADGFISVVGNIDPELMLEIKEGIHITKAGIDRLLTLSHLMFLPKQPNPKPVHNAIEMIRRATNQITDPATFRLPGGPLDNNQQEYLAKGLKKEGINSKPFGNNYTLVS